jgi:DNA-binding transcriptional ArsR family regulator
MINPVRAEVTASDTGHSRPGRVWSCGRTRECVPRRGSMSRPLYQVKAEFFKALAHPARIRILELLSVREHAVSEMLPEVGIEAAHLSQQLSVLRRMNLVVTRKQGSTVIYSLVSPHVAELLAVARRILTEVLASQVDLLDGLRAADETPTR